MFRSYAEMARRIGVWSALGLFCLVFWVGIAWLVMSCPGVFVRGVIGIGLLLGCTCFWKQSDSRMAKAVSVVLTALVGYVAFSVLGVF